jgi:3-(3-hydroxy-phenyl)propionate hydroxylase
VVVVGAGPVGLAAAIELAQSGVAVVVLDDDDTVSIGSRGVCYAKRTLEVLDRIGCRRQACVDKGVSWNVGRTFFRERGVQLQPAARSRPPAPRHDQPAAVLPGEYLRSARARTAQPGPALSSNKVHQCTPGDGATLRVETPDGAYTLTTDWLVVADGARSPIRTHAGAGH